MRTTQSLGSGVFGWNAVEQKVQLTEFWDDGYYHHRLFTIESDKLGEGEEVSGGRIPLIVFLSNHVS